MLPCSRALTRPPAASSARSGHPYGNEVLLAQQAGQLKGIAAGRSLHSRRAPAGWVRGPHDAAYARLLERAGEHMAGRGIVGERLRSGLRADPVHELGGGRSLIDVPHREPVEHCDTYRTGVSIEADEPSLRHPLHLSRSHRHASGDGTRASLRDQCGHVHIV